MIDSVKKTKKVNIFKIKTDNPAVIAQSKRIVEARKELSNMQNTFKSILANPDYDNYMEQILEVEKL